MQMLLIKHLIDQVLGAFVQQEWGFKIFLNIGLGGSFPF